MHRIPILALFGATSALIIPEPPFANTSVVKWALSNMTLPDITNLTRNAAQHDCTRTPEADQGHGPMPSHDTPFDFLNSHAMRDLAHHAPTPRGFDRVFRNRHAAILENVSNGMHMVGGPLYLLRYDTTACANHCVNSYQRTGENCTGFNVFIERKPVLRPGPSCPNPASTSVITCTVWNKGVHKKNAINEGQTLGSVDGFRVKIAASNGYVLHKQWMVRSGAKHNESASLTVLAILLGLAALLVTTV